MAAIASHFQKAEFCLRSVNTRLSSRIISHFVPTLLLYEVMLKDGEGQRREDVKGHWDHPVGIVLHRETGNCCEEGCREWRGGGELHVMKMCVFLQE